MLLGVLVSGKIQHSYSFHVESAAISQQISKKLTKPCSSKRTAIPLYTAVLAVE
jgi:hypothetical protein